ncbi:MAG: hypothetical protein OEZ36_14075, partial [Spirochaetota bacterium]|nr:hypothetical protein [Spirochaetota bacterium]
NPLFYCVKYYIIQADRVFKSGIAVCHLESDAFAKQGFIKVDHLFASSIIQCYLKILPSGFSFA